MSSLDKFINANRVHDNELAILYAENLRDCSNTIINHYLHYIQPHYTEIKMFANLLSGDIQKVINRL